MAISAIVTSIHLPLAWALTNGAAGLPELGGAGCGVSTAIINWLALGCGLAYLARNPAYRQYRIFKGWQAPHPGELGKLLRLGGRWGCRPSSTSAPSPSSRSWWPGWASRPWPATG
jgi:MATE family multidrug resistance protein